MPQVFWYTYLLIMKSFNQAIANTKTALIIASRPLDFDSLGSGLILKKYLESLNKKITLSFPYKLRDYEKEFNQFLPYFNEIEDGDTRELLKKKKFDLLIFLDGTNLVQYYDSREEEGNPPDLTFYDKVIHIDHHLQHPEKLGTITICDPLASSTAEIILTKLIPESFIDKNIATLGYAALAGDTGNFRWNFNPKTLKLASLLLVKGGNSLDVVEHIFNFKPKIYLDLLGFAIKNAEFYEDVRTIILPISHQKLQSNNFDDNKMGILKIAFIEELARRIRGYDRAVMLTENKPQRIHISARGNNLYNKISLPEMFLELGGNGGGHFNACALDIESDLEKVKELLLKTLAKWQKISS